MALLVFSSSVASLSPPLAFRSSSVSWPSTTSITITAKSPCGFRFGTPSVSVASITVAVRAIPDPEPSGSGDRISAVDNVGDYDEDEEGNLIIGDLPLESKLMQKLEHKMKMKLAKKVRLRRKKLIRKRRMRKKGRWPPSKMKKLKNV